MKLIRYQIPSRYQTVANQVSLLDEVDRLFTTAFTAKQEPFFPVDLYQDKDAFIIRAEVPGFRKEDLSVEVADDVLTVGARYAQPTDEKNNNATTEERKVTRSVPLPDQADATKIAASYENGVLTVTLPKREETKPRQVAVEIK